MKDGKRHRGREKKEQDFEEQNFEGQDFEGQDFEGQDFEDRDFGEQGFEEQDFEELDMGFETEGERDGEEAWEDEPEPLAGWVMALIFVGMALLAALICLVLWRFTHSGRGGDNGQDSFAQVTAAPEITPERTEEPVVEAPPEPALETAPEPAPEVTPEPTTESTAEPAAEAAPWPGAASDGQAREPVSGNGDMTFSELQESVTPKDVVNLRSVPTTTDETNIVVQAKNGEVLLRTGINQDTGWSRIDYNGQMLYAVNQYLTTDLNYKTPVVPSDPNRVGTISGRIIIFTNCDDWISPKEYVNLRTEPSTSEGNATVGCQLNYGEKAHRTGCSPDSGWSRVEYNGQVLYVVTSLMYEVNE